MNRTHRTASTALLILAAFTAISSCGDRPALTEPDQRNTKKGKVKVASLSLDSPTLSVGGAGTGYTATLENAGDPLSNVVLEGEIVQEMTRRPAGGAPVSCPVPDGTLPSGTCTMGSVAAVSNEGPGTGLLVPGDARFVLRLVQDGVTLDQRIMGVTLVLSSRIASLSLASTTLVIDDETGTTYEVTVENPTGSGQSGITLQGEIVQGDALKGAGGFSADCPPDHVSGVLPAGSCTMTLTANARNAAGGSGTLVPGGASFRLTLSQTVGGVTTVLDTETVPITLVGNVGRIVFWSARDQGASELYAMDGDGANQLRLTTNSVGEGHPSVTADGSVIAFGSDLVGGNTAIFTMSAEGSQFTQRSFPPGGNWFDLEPSISPDGTKIAFARLDNLTGESEVFVMDADGSSVLQLTTTNDGRAGSPAFSRDGARIVFVRCDETTPGPQTCIVVVMNADGSNQVPLSQFSSPGPLQDPSFSPDGTKVVFASGNLNDQGIYVVDVGGADPVRLTMGSQSSPSFSPDGTKIAFESGSQVYLMNADGTSPVALTTQGPDGDPLFRP